MLLIGGCDRISPTNICYRKKCQNANATCLIQSNLVFGSLPSSSSTSTESNSIESASDGGNTFSSTYSISLPESNSSSPVNFSGAITNASDVDIYRGDSSPNFSPNEVPLRITQTSGNATCVLYTRLSGDVGFSLMATPDSTFNLIGTLSSSATNITLLRSSIGSLFIRCSGSASATYTVRLENPNYQAPISTLSLFANASLLSCLSAEDTCRRQCEKDNDY